MLVSFPRLICSRCNRTGSGTGGYGFPAGGEEAGPDGRSRSAQLPENEVDRSSVSFHPEGVLRGQTRGQAVRLDDPWQGFLQPVFERGVRGIRLLRQGESVREADAQPAEFPLQKGTGVCRRSVGDERSSVDDDTAGRDDLFPAGVPASHEANRHEQRCRHGESGEKFSVHRSNPVRRIPCTVRLTVEPDGVSFPQQSTVPSASLRIAWDGR